MNGRANAIFDAADDVDRPRTLEYEVASTIPLDEATFDDELVEAVLGRNAMAVIYGDSNSGKTFLAIDLGARICLSEDWLGNRTAGGVVVYLATEAVQSVVMRLRGWQRHHEQQLDRFVIVKSPVNLFDGKADTGAVIRLIEQIGRQHGPVALIVGDTLARISAGANENSGEDMGVVLQNADTIRTATGAAFMWIHHCGKDQAKGMRGWSGMRAAIDTEVEVTCDEATGARVAEITKQRDLPGKGRRIGFRLEPVHLGVNRWGSPRTTCVVVDGEAPAKRERGKRTSEIAGAVTEMLTVHGTGMVKGTIVKHFDGRYSSCGVYRELKAMLNDGRLVQVGPVIAIPGKPAISGGAD